MKTVLVVGRDWKFRALLRAQLREEGYEALGFETLAEAAEEIGRSAPPPAALVFDTAAAPSAELERLAALAAPVPLLVVAAAQENVTAPRARVLHRPLPLGQVVAAVRTLSNPA